MTSIRDNNSEQASTLEILQQARSLTEVILVGHHRIENLLDQYVQNLIPNRQALRVELLTYSEKLEIVLADIDLPSWREEEGDDDVDFWIAEEMLGHITMLDELRRHASFEVLAIIYPRLLKRYSGIRNILKCAQQWLTLPPSTGEEELRGEVAGHIACVHAYFESFTRTMSGKE